MKPPPPPLPRPAMKTMLIRQQEDGTKKLIPATPGARGVDERVITWVRTRLGDVIPTIFMLPPGADADEVVRKMREEEMGEEQEIEEEIMKKEGRREGGVKKRRGKNREKGKKKGGGKEKEEGKEDQKEENTADQQHGEKHEKEELNHQNQNGKDSLHPPSFPPPSSLSSSSSSSASSLSSTSSSTTSSSSSSSSSSSDSSSSSSSSSPPLPPIDPSPHSHRSLPPRHSPLLSSSFPRPVSFVLLYSHGNAMDLYDTIYTLRALSETFHVAVLGYEYSGYGMCSNAAVSEDAVYASIEAAYETLMEYHRIPPHRIILYGRSIGSGPSTHLARKLGSSIGGLFLQSPLCSVVRTVLSFQRTWFFDMFANIDKIGEVKCPVFICHGKKDTVVPFSHGEELYQKIWRKKKKEMKTKEESEREEEEELGDTDVEEQLHKPDSNFPHDSNSDSDSDSDDIAFTPLWVSDAGHNDMPRPWLWSDIRNEKDSDQQWAEKQAMNLANRTFIEHVKKYLDFVEKWHKNRIKKERKKERKRMREERDRIIKEVEEEMERQGLGRRVGGGGEGGSGGNDGISLEQMQLAIIQAARRSILHDALLSQSSPLSSSSRRPPSSISSLPPPPPPPSSSSSFCAPPYSSNSPSSLVPPFPPSPLIITLSSSSSSIPSHPLPFSISVHAPPSHPSSSSSSSSSSTSSSAFLEETRIKMRMEQEKDGKKMNSTPKRVSGSGSGRGPPDTVPQPILLQMVEMLTRSAQQSPSSSFVRSNRPVETINFNLNDVVAGSGTNGTNGTNGTSVRIEIDDDDGEEKEEEQVAVEAELEEGSIDEKTQLHSKPSNPAASNSINLPVDPLASIPKVLVPGSKTNAGASFSGCGSALANSSPTIQIDLDEMEVEKEEQPSLNSRPPSNLRETEAEVEADVDGALELNSHRDNETVAKEFEIPTQTVNNMAQAPATKSS